MVSEALRVVGEMTENISGSLNKVSSAASAASNRLNDVGDQLSEISAKGTVAETASDSLARSQAALAATSNMAASSLDRAGDESLEMAGKMSAAEAVTEALAFDMGNLSLNLGAFTVAIRNLATQIPTLTAVVGTLSAALIGLAAAAGGAALALGGIFAGGLVAQAQALDERFESIEGTMEAIETMMAALRDLFMEALEPIVNQEFISMFTAMVEAIASAINVFAQWVDQLVRGNDEFSEFSQSVQEVMGTGFVELLNAMQFALEENGDILVGVVETLTSGFARAIVWSTNVLDELSGVLSETHIGLTDFVSEIVDLAMSVLSGLLPVLRIFLDIGTTIADMLNNLSNSAAGTIVMLLTMAVALDRIGARMVGVVNTSMAVFSSLQQVTAGTNLLSLQFSRAIRRIGTFITEWSSMSTALQGTRLEGVANSISSLASDALSRFTLAVGGAEARLQEFLFTSTKQTRNAMGRFMGNMTGVRRAMVSMSGAVLSGAESIGIFGNMGDVARIQTALFGDASLAAAVKQGIMNGALGTGIQALQGYAASLKQTAAAQWFLNTAVGSAIANLWTYVSSAVAAKLSTDAMIPSFIGLDITLTSLTGGLTKIIPALLGLAAAGGLIVGAMGNMSGATSTFHAIISSVRDAITFMVNAVLPVFISFWNMLVELFDIIVSPVMAIVDGFGRIAEALGLVSSSGGTASGVLGALMSIISGLFEAFSIVFDIVGAVADVVGDVLVVAINLVFDIIVSLIGVTREIIGVFVDLATNHIPFLSEALDGIRTVIGMLVDAFLAIPRVVKSVFESVLSRIKSAIQTGIDFINGLIDAANKVPGVSISKVGEGQDALGGATVDSEAVGEGAQAVEEGAQGALGRFTPGAQPELSFEENVNNNVEQVNADPEDEERLKRVIKDAMDEANQFRRQSDGFSG